jgi:hypothetical protein
MKSLPFFKIAFLGLFFVGGLVPGSSAGVVLSNLEQPGFSSSPLSTAFWFGNRFVTDGSAAAFVLERVTLSLAPGIPPDASSNLFVAIYSDDGAHPGTLLESLSGSFRPTTAGDYTYASTGLGLAPNASYWVVAGVMTGAGNYAWEVTESNLFTGTWSIPPTATHIYSFNQGGQWEPAQNGFPRQFGISAVAVPEPSIAAFLGLGIGAWIVCRRGRPFRR